MCVLAFFATYFTRIAISPIVPFIIDDFNVTNTQIGFALTGMWLTYGLTHFPSGVLADRYGEKPIILIAVGGTAIASLLIAFAPTYWVFVVLTLLLGGTGGLYYSVGTSLLSRTHDNLGSAVGIHYAGAPLAGLVAPATAAWIGVQYGWRSAMIFSGLVALPVFFLFSWKVRSTTPRQPDRPMRTQFKLSILRRHLFRPTIVFSISIAMVCVFILQGIVSFLPTFLVEHRSQTPTFAGIVFSVIFIGRGGMQIVIGRAADRFGRDFAIALCMLAGGAGITLLVVGPGLAALAVAVLLVSVGSSFFAALDPRFLDEFSEDERGAGFGLVRTVYSVIGASGSLSVGLFADLFGWAISFSIIAVLYLLVFVAIAVNSALELGY